eukprot:CAMPEP_0114576514 /NCGR_PEP_ID=MMETSP0125-20121206/1263_1 /TAXON_ID=485358 ORGANISM="Aristerostoma sp., Strain ATCC 50986" /NCGR_SAMPLE_ID=MMETSP0125 /ASSEMBLY_ACC=CAM_ASM_000245 /LENGTH=348 /DNA_ID=CAMNT_0001765079 /DNA_START=558 /DNA_END=1601 /DNA_ORIENTATION=+
MENSVNFLVSVGCSPNDKDQETGSTPLHLGVMSGNTRVVRKLLVKGADKKLKDANGKLPIDLAHDYELEAMVKMLKGRNFLINCLNIKPDLQKKKSRATLGWFIFLFATLLLSVLFFVLPFIESKIWFVLLFTAVGFMVLFFTAAWLTDPGYIKKQDKDHLFELMVKNDPQSICFDCCILKPPRSKHCELCNACISVYDHHCPWINNCVGCKNHKHFLGFIFSAFFALFFVTVMSIIALDTSEPDNDTVFAQFFIGHEGKLKALKIISCIYSLIISVLLLIPLFLLNFVQWGNFLSGKTTNERFGYQAPAGSYRKVADNFGSDIVSPLNGEFTGSTNDPNEKEETPTA